MDQEKIKPLKKAECSDAEGEVEKIKEADEKRADEKAKAEYKKKIQICKYCNTKVLPEMRACPKCNLGKVSRGLWG